MRTYIIGRSPHADIILADNSVGHHHAELVSTDDGRYFITDCGGTGGTWLARSAGADQPGADDWQRLRQAFIGIDDPLRLGDCECRLRQLLQLLADSDSEFNGPAERDSLPHGSVQRDPHTGEIVRRRI